MVELYAWANIWGDEIQEDEHSYYSRTLEPLIASKIDDLGLKDLLFCRVNFEFLNGELTLNLVIKGNRFRQEFQDVFDLFGYIAEIGKGSYGLIYMYDNENPDGKDNVFQAFVLKNGVLKEAADPFLSPVLPDTEE